MIFHAVRTFGVRLSKGFAALWRSDYVGCVVDFYRFGYISM